MVFPFPGPNKFGEKLGSAYEETGDMKHALRRQRNSGNHTAFICPDRCDAESHPDSTNQDRAFDLAQELHDRTSVAVTGLMRWQISTEMICDL